MIFDKLLQVFIQLFIQICRFIFTNFLLFNNEPRLHLNFLKFGNSLILHIFDKKTYIKLTIFLFYIKFWLQVLLNQKKSLVVYRN